MQRCSLDSREFISSSSGHGTGPGGILFGLVGFFGALFRKVWIPHFVVSWAAWCLLFYLMLGQPPLVVGLVLNIVLSAALVWAFLRKGTTQKSGPQREM